ncbi:tetratricopeptide repeat-containing sensor histidine kinase [Maribacter sp.]
MNFKPKVVVALCCSLFLLSGVQFQSTALDSLEIALQNHKQKDSVRVNLLNEIAELSYKKNLDKTMSYVAASERISDSLGYKKGLARSLLIKGKAQIEQSRFEKAYQTIDEALQLYEVARSKKGISECYSTLGFLFYRKEDQKQAIAYHQKSMDINQELGNKEAISNDLANIGRVYFELGNYVESVSYFKRALAIDNEIGDEEKISQNLGNIGVIYAYQGNHPQALEYYNKSITIDEKRGDTLGIIAVLNNKGIIYQTMQNYDQAIAHYVQALQMQKKYGNKKNMADILINLGFVYEQNKEYKSAYNYLKEALDLCKEINYKSGEAYALNNMGNVFLVQGALEQALHHFEQAKTMNLSVDNQLGLCVSYLGLAEVYVGQKNNDKALMYALKSKGISSKNKFLEYQRDVSELLSKIHINRGNYKKAYESHQRFKVLNDSLFNKENVQKIAQLEYEYKYKQAMDSVNIRELQLTKTVTSTNLDLEKSRRKYLWAIIGVLSVSLLLGAIIFYQKFKNMKVRNENIVMEQKLLRSQMTPHFIFNSLSVLQGMILNNEDKKSVSYLSKFSKLLRITLENSRDKTVLLSEEITGVENYLALQNLENEAYLYNVSVANTIDPTLFKIPPMLIQPFVENAVKHAFADQKENREIEVDIKHIHEKLTCTIIDNGIGVDLQKKGHGKDKKSMATTITSERLELLAKDLKMESSVTVEDRKKYNAQGTLVTLVIPYVKII